MKTALNSEVKEYIKESVSQVLDGCELFTKTFGKGFAKKSMEKNISEINEISRQKGISGEYNIKDETITIRHKGEALEVSDIKESEKMQKLILHEGGHAVFLRTSEDYTKYSVITGTGLKVVFDDGRVIGTGLGEGYINWIYYKAGIEIGTYERLTNIFKILEIARNEENVMSIGKGDPIDGVAKKLGMNREEYLKMSEKADEILTLEKNKGVMLEIGNVMKMYEAREELDEDRKKHIEMIYEKVQGKPEYLEIFSAREYKDHLAYLNKEDTIQERMNYLKTEVIENEAQAREVTEELLEEIFVRYFKDKMQITEKTSQSMMAKWEKLHKLVVKTRDIDMNEDAIWRYEEPEISRFVKTGYKEMVKRYTLNVMRQLDGNSNTRDKKKNSFKQSISDMSRYSGKAGVSKKAIKDNNRGKRNKSWQTR